MLSLEEANAICNHAQKISGGQAVSLQSPSFVPLLRESPTPPSGAAVGPDASAASTPRPSSPNAAVDSDSAGAGDDAEGEETAEGKGHRGDLDPQGSFAGLKQYSASDGDLNELLSTLFKKADTEKKVRHQKMD